MTPFDGTDFQVETKPDVALEPWRKVLMDAADYIAVHGWCQNLIRTADGRVCLNGAIKAVSGVGTPEKAWWTELGMEAVDAMSRSIGKWNTDWNDAPGRTASEVINALRECARS